ncbi:winged helix-turn-helix transcriptional regulator [Haladaptatus salinisoli]|uniref:winged helix-turn-helix transcriptional regulator n=1 Tax=Haladaptatus salinisoli TaxID=2884876 RepID=UPI001D0B718B|nr:helix-turn-helix domain-containing protein [Haladaptatus salinisoli]
MSDDWQRTWHAVRSVLGSKWAFHVVRALSERARGFNDLRRTLGGVSAKTLSERLQELRCLGFVEKEVHATSPPTTTYRLTDHGESLASVMDDLESLVDVVECPGGDCPVPAEAAPDCPCPASAETAPESSCDC